MGTWSIMSSLIRKPIVYAWCVADELILRITKSEQLSDVASGLDYLHEKDIVHGDLKGVRSSGNFVFVAHLDTQANILVNDKCHAVLADFGLIAVIPTNSFRLTMTTVGAGTVRWMAPELLNPEAYNFTHCKPSKESDMYALGMVIYEVGPIFRRYELTTFNLYVKRRLQVISRSKRNPM